MSDASVRTTVEEFKNLHDELLDRAFGVIYFTTAGCVFADRLGEPKHAYPHDQAAQVAAGTTVIKEIDPYVLLEKLSDREAREDSGFLPPNVVRCGRTGQRQFAALYVAAHTQRLLLRWGASEGTAGKGEGSRDTYVHVPLPDLLFAGNDRNYWAWAIDGAWARERRALGLPVCDPAAPLAICPLPNVNYGAGGVCWGGNRPPACAPQTIGGALGLFLDSAFTSSWVKDKCRKLARDVRDYLVRLAAEERDSFPEEELLPAGLTVMQALDAVFGNNG